MLSITEISDGVGLSIACIGVLDGDALYQAKVGLNERFPRMPEWYFALVDLTAATDFNITATDLDRLANLDRKLAQFTRPGLPVAIVVQSDLGFGISRMWQAVSEPTGWDTQVFRDRSRAVGWIRHQVLSVYARDLPQLLEPPDPKARKSAESPF